MNYKSFILKLRNKQEWDKVTPLLYLLDIKHKDFDKPYPIWMKCERKVSFGMDFNTEYYWSLDYASKYNTFTFTNHYKIAHYSIETFLDNYIKSHDL